MKMPPVITATNLTKTYRRGREEVRALDGVSFEINRGEFVAVVGPSGAGKTTLLNLLGAMDTPTSGRIWTGWWDSPNPSGRIAARSCARFSIGSTGAGHN